MKKNANFKQGIFTPKHPEKYKGSFPITYRSGWECKCMLMFDHNPNILSWGSETVVIPYQNPLTGRISRYFTDFNVTMRDKNGDIKKFLIEIKPHAQTLPPSQRNKKTKTLLRQQAEYVKNQAKWKAATEFSQKHGCQFVILTEKHLMLS